MSQTKQQVDDLLSSGSNRLSLWSRPYINALVLATPSDIPEELQLYATAFNRNE